MPAVGATQASPRPRHCLSDHEPLSRLDGPGALGAAVGVRADRGIETEMTRIPYQTPAAQI
jgi:hypothetical protein